MNVGINKLSSKSLFILFLFVYAGVLALSFLFAYQVRFNFDVPSNYRWHYLQILPAILVVKLFSLWGLGQFGLLDNFSTRLELRRVALAILLPFLVLLAWGYFGFPPLNLPGENGPTMSRGVMGIDAMLSFISIVIIRFLAPKLDKDLRQKQERTPDVLDENDGILDRRKFMFAGIFTLFWILFSYFRLPKILVTFTSKRIELGEFTAGYTPTALISRGKSLSLFYHSKHKVNVDLIRLGEGKELIGNFNMPANVQDNNYHPYKGFNWKTPFQLPTNDLKGGYYYLHLKSRGHKAVVPFIVNSERDVGITLVASTNTWNAYNSYVCGNYGGDVYPKYTKPKIPGQYDADKAVSWVASKFGYTTSVPAYLVPLPLPQNRPISWAEEIISINDPTIPNGSHLLGAEWRLVHFLERNKIAYRVITDMEFHSSYQPHENEITIFHAHSEYWSESMKKNLEKHYKDGRALFFFSGNSIFRDIEPYKGGIKVVSQKSSSRRTRKLTGAFYDAAGFNTFAPYKVMDRDHWIFEGLSRKIKFFGQVDGANKFDGASGFETDKTDWSEAAVLVAQGVNPSKDSRRGGADMLVKENDAGGIIFNASSVAFTSAISNDDTIKLIISNLFKRAGRPISID